MVYQTCTSVLTDVTVYERFKQMQEANTSDVEKALLN